MALRKLLVYFMLDQYGWKSHLSDNSHIDFQQKLQKNLWDIWKCSFMSLCKLSVAVQPLWTLDGGSARRKAAICTQNKRTQTSMSWLGFQTTIPVFERAKTVHAFDGAATVFGSYVNWAVLIWINMHGYRNFLTFSKVDLIVFQQNVWNG
jgi:hypothetical protein